MSCVLSYKTEFCLVLRMVCAGVCVFDLRVRVRVCMDGCNFVTSLKPADNSACNFVSLLELAVYNVC